MSEPSGLCKFMNLWHCKYIACMHEHRLKRVHGIGNEAPSRCHPCFPAVLIEAYFQRGNLNMNNS